MDHATLTDNNGRKADFRQVVLIMTSNAGSREMSAGSIGFNDAGVERGLDTRQRASQARSRAAIEKVFSPEFRNRLDAIVSFQPLTPDVMETIVDKFIIQLEEQLAERRIAIALHAGQAVSRGEGLRSDLRRPAARARDPDRSTGSADRRNPVRRSGEWRHRRDRLDGERCSSRSRRSCRNERNRFRRNRRGYSATRAQRGSLRSGSAMLGLAGRSSPINMDEHEIPVKVVDRRWWARGENAEATSEDRTSLKPTYVEELERKVAEKDSRPRSTSAKYRQASQEFEDARARMRKELARDAERNRREVLVGLLEVLDNLDRAVDAARSGGHESGRSTSPGGRDRPAAVPRQVRPGSASQGCH